MATIDDVLQSNKDLTDMLREFISRGGGLGSGRVSGGLNFSDFSEFQEYLAEEEGKFREKNEMSEREKRDFYEENASKYHQKFLDEKEKARLEREALDSLIEGTEEYDKQLQKVIESEEKTTYFLKQYLEYQNKANKTSPFSATIKDGKNVVETIKNVYKEIENLIEPWAKVDAAASKYAKTVGMSQKGMANLRRDTMLNMTKNRLATKYNISSDELIEAQANYLKASGRNIRIDAASQESMAAMKAMGGNGNELAAMYDNFGVSLEETGKHVGKMFADASKEGLSFEKYSDNVAKNIKIAQNYTFKNGLKGLESMAKKATAMKMDMQQVAQLADKVSTVEGAVEVAAQLQVLGGPFAKLADPMGMLNEGLNDMEGLQDRLIKMIGGLGSFDQETGEVKVSAFNKQRIKAAASAMGVSYDSLMESANAQARRGEIEKQISASSVASGFDKDMKELIMNSGVIKDGKAGVSIRGQFKSLDELSGEDYEALKKETQTESEDIKDIAIDLRSFKDIVSGFGKQTEAWQARMFGFLGVGTAIIIKALSWLKIIHIGLVAIKGLIAANNIAGHLSGRGIGGGRMGGARSRMGGMSSSMAGGAAGAVGASKVVGSGSSWGAILTQTIKTPKKGLANAGTKLTGGVVKGGIKRSARRGALKLLGKDAYVALGSRIGKVGVQAATVGAVGSTIKETTNTTTKTAAKTATQETAKQSAKTAAKEAAKTTAKTTAKTAAKTATQETIKTASKGAIAKHGLKRAVRRTAIKTLGKEGTKKLATGLAKGGPLGIIGAIGDIATDSLVAAGKMKRGGAGHHVAKGLSGAASGAAMGMMIGSIGGPIGTAIGTAVGATIGAVQGVRNASLNKEITKKLDKKGVQMVGVYNNSKLDYINKSLEDGHLSKRMRKKLEKSGDHELIKQIDAVAEKTGGKRKFMDKKIANHIPILREINMVNKGLKKVSNTKIGRALGLPSSVSSVFGKKKSKESAASILNRYNTTKIKPVPEKGMNSKYGSVNKKNNELHLKTDPYNINLNGTLNLKGENGQQYDLMRDLKNNPQTARKLSGMVDSSLNELKNGGINKSQRQYYPYE